MTLKQANHPVFETVQVLELVLVTASGERIDLKDIFAGIQLFESIFESFVSGKVFISDTSDMYKNLSLSGNEELLLTIQERITNIQQTHSFRLYKINRDFDVTRSSAKSKILECYFYSPEKLTDSIKRVSRKFWDYPDLIIEAIVRELWQSSKQLFVDFTSNFVEYNSNFQNPSAIIDYLVENSISEAGELDFVFYETLAGFHFAPISFLLTQAAVETMTYLPAREKSFRIDDIHFFRQDAYFDINVDAKVGLFGKTLYKMNDGDRYGVVKTPATYSENAARFTSSGRNLLFPSDLDNANNMVAAYHHNHDVAQVRTAQLSTLMHNNKFMIRVQGTLERKVGDILNIKYPNQDNFQEPNASLDGSWLITAIKHQISQDLDYTQNIMLAKNARQDNQILPAAPGNIVL